MSEAFWTHKLAEREAQGLRRMLREVESSSGAMIRFGGRECINFSSNNYLGLGNDERVIEAAARATRTWGWGSGASRLVSGTLSAHRDLEDRLAGFFGREAALVFGSGYHANLAAVCIGAGKGDVVFSDERNHASLIDGARLSGARIVVFPHRDYAALEALLSQHDASERKLIVSDSLFSVDGDFASLSILVDLKQRYGATLCVDEAHAIGVYGMQGRGLAEMQGVAEGIDIFVGTLSKSLGGVGGFVCGSRVLVETLINTARPFIFSTAPPAAACAAGLAALEIVEQEPERRRKVLALAARLRMELGDLRGHDLSGSSSQIVPLVVGPPEQAVSLCDRLLDRGLFVPAFRPPSVPPGASCLRISVTAAHESTHIEALIAALDALWSPAKTKNV